MEIILKSLPHFPKECVYKPNLFYLKIPRQDLYQNLCDRSELKHYGPKESRWLSKTSSYHTYCKLLKSEENLAVEVVVYGTIQRTHHMINQDAYWPAKLFCFFLVAHIIAYSVIPFPIYNCIHLYYEHICANLFCLVMYLCRIIFELDLTLAHITSSSQ